VSKLTFAPTLIAAEAFIVGALRLPDAVTNPVTTTLFENVALPVTAIVLLSVAAPVTASVLAPVTGPTVSKPAVTIKIS
jgi:hypothetical protein